MGLCPCVWLLHFAPCSMLYFNKLALFNYHTEAIAVSLSAWENRISWLWNTSNEGLNVFCKMKIITFRLNRRKGTPFLKYTLKYWWNFKPIRHRFSSSESKECLLLNDFNTFKVRSHCEVLETLQDLTLGTLRALAPAIVFGTIYSPSATITKTCTCLMSFILIC